jgi:hypothetical protein
VVIWCIHDYLALSILVGWVTKGYYTCVRCYKDLCTRRSMTKICYINHHHFSWRKRKTKFDDTIGNREMP